MIQQNAIPPRQTAVTVAKNAAAAANQSNFAKSSIGSTNEQEPKEIANSRRTEAISVEVSEVSLNVMASSEIWMAAASVFSKTAIN